MPKCKKTRANCPLNSDKKTTPQRETNKQADTRPQTHRLKEKLIQIQMIYEETQRSLELECMK